MKKLYTYLSIGILFLVSFTATSQVLITQDFEATSFPAGWTFSSLPPFTITTANPCAGLRSTRTTVSTSNPNASLRSPSMVTTGDDIEISFKYKIINETGGAPVTGDFGFFQLQFTTNATAGSPTWTTYDTIDQNSPNSAACSTHTSIIPAVDVPVGSDFGWRIRSNWVAGSYYIYVDDFRAIEQVDCIQPIFVTLDDITFNSVEIGWTEINTPPATSWDIEVTPQGAPAGFGFGVANVTTSNNPETISTGLIDGESYDVYIRANCGPGNQSNWSGPFNFQTIAIGSDCSAPIVVGSVFPPYTQTSDTQIYGNNYSGSPGINCDALGNYLDGNDVVYLYTPADDDILQIEISNVSGDAVGVFVYESCADIGTSCVDGATTSTGDDFGVVDLFVTAGQDYYIVVSSLPVLGVETTDYTITITGFDCATFTQPDGSAVIDFVDGQFLFEYSGQGGQGVYPTITGATLSWFEDALLTIPVDPATYTLVDGDVFYVIQTIGTCDSAALMVTFDEFDCLGELEIISTDNGDGVCYSGTIQLSATANSSNIYWYDDEFDDDPISVGPTYTTPVINQTTSYWVSEVFFGEGTVTGQANPGPNTISTSTLNNYGLVFTATNNFTLVNVQIFSTAGGGPMTVELRNMGGTTLETRTVNIPSGSTANPTPFTVPLNMNISAGEYRLLKTTGSAMINSAIANTTYPYPIGTSGQVTNGTSATFTNTSYYYFYNWTIIENRPLCESPRTEVIAEVFNEIPVSVQAANPIVCLGDSTDLTVTSANSNYIYVWNPGNLQGSTVSVSPTQNTTYTVTATDSVTGCVTSNQISLQVIGAPSSIEISPDPASVCLGESIELSAGSIGQNFNAATNNWTTTNSSTGASAAWTLVPSPHTTGTGASITSPDYTQFYFTNANSLGSPATVNTRLTSPSISLVGVTNASLNFNHYYRHHPITTAAVEVSTNGGTTWSILQTFTSDQGSASNFTNQSISLNSYVNMPDVRVRFRFEGGAGWWWAIDDVVVKRRYTSSQVTWTPQTNLFMDAAATVPYTAGTNASNVYFSSSVEDDYTYTATLNVTGCSAVTEDITVTVIETPLPVGAPEQFFESGETLANLDVTGMNIKFYMENASGNFVLLPANTPLQHDTVYYATQQIDACESEMIMIIAYYNCPSPTNVTVDHVSTSKVTVSWDITELDKIEHFYYVITEANTGNVQSEGYILYIFQSVTITGLTPNTDYIYTIYSMCNESNGVFSYNTDSATFTTLDGLSVDEPGFAGLSYYPNPVSNNFHINNMIPMDGIEVYNLIGQKLVEQKPGTTMSQIDFSSFASGAYLVKISVGDSVKIIKVIRE